MFFPGLLNHLKALAEVPGIFFLGNEKGEPLGHHGSACLQDEARHRHTWGS